MNEPICPHCGGGPADEQHQRECEEDTVLFQQQARIVVLERQLAEVQEIYDALGKLEVLKGFREQLNGFSGHSSILIDKLKVTIDAILRGTKEGDE